MQNKLKVPLLASVALLGGVGAGLVGLASAQTTTASPTTTTYVQGKAHTPPTAMGTVTAISGSTLTITDKRTSTTYTVNASGATVEKDRNTTAALSDIKVGDMVGVEGTQSGTTITATNIHVGFGKGPGFGGRGGGPGGVMGTVSAISGNTVTVTDKDGGTYAIDASSATVNQSGTASTLSSVKIGDTVMVHGTLTTASMTAKAIDDGVPSKGARPSGPTTTTKAQ